MHISEEIGARLQAERKRLGLNQEQFAEVMGVSKRTQAAYEGGNSEPGTVYLNKGAAVGLDVLYVVTGERKPAQTDSLTEEENTLVQRYRAMTPESRASVDRVTEALSVFI